jgi:Protein of unknown function (DUF1236)
MTNRFMMSVAAIALIAGTGFANAQGTGPGREAPSAGATVQQNAPSADRATTAAPAAREAAEPTAPSSGAKATQPSSGMKATQSDPKAPGAAKNQRAEDNMQGQKPNGMRSETNDNAKGGKEMKAEGRNGNTDMKANGTTDMKAEGRNGNMNADSKTAVDSKSQTTGQAGAGAKLSGEQRTRITTVIREQHVQPVEHVNFSISVGTRVPRGVSFHPLPAELITIYPDWRGYEFILVGDQIVVVNPRTLEIVAVLDV